ncbi:LysR family transcriptional regulator [Marinicellulosiphila megalodicopiae]|uniref:LysR family transcriptional regulator n=1 Tax=Marinicellulosiphila megalodicopiae TaxID=2724896 RepID=UPI003BAF7062
MNWDDLKYFLAVARNGSVRSAAKVLGVNHTTVSRRIKQFEEDLGERLFDRSNGGYERTIIADEIYQEAIHLEERMFNVSRKVACKDQTLTGDIRITVPEGVGECLLMPSFSKFCDSHTKINIEIISSAVPLNLSNREADVAIRICKNPPEHLVGRKLANMHRACYVSAQLKEQIKDEDFVKSLNWLGFSQRARRPVGQVAKDYPKLKSKHYMLNMNMQVAACKLNMGVAILPCFIADNDSSLIRIPPFTDEHQYDLWLLYHPDLRKSKKIQTFVHFLYEQFEILKPLIEGECFTLSP